MSANNATSTDRNILRVATELFSERGFDGVTVDQIGKRAGVTGPAVYWHFGSKDEILLTLFDEALDRFLAQLGPELDDPAEELSHLVRAHAQLVLSDPKSLNVYVREQRSLKPSLRRRIQRRERAYIERWTAAVARRFPDRTETSVRVAVYAALGLLNSAANWPAALVKSDGLIDELHDLVMAGLIGAGRPQIVSQAQITRSR